MNNLDYLIFSSHKTSTQSLLKILHKNNYKASHMHVLFHLSLLHPECNKIYKLSDLKQIFLEKVKLYVTTNKKKLSIISIVRNPLDRLLSSFFQSYHSDEIDFKHIRPHETTVSKLNENELYVLYYNNILNGSLPGMVESIDQLSYVFDTDIIRHLKQINNYYFFENDYIKLYVLKYKEIISANNISYLNNALNIQMSLNGYANLSEEKLYYNKYKQLKQMIKNNVLIDGIINSKFHQFYLNQ